MLRDLRFALRVVRRSAGFTAIVVLTLALGIGANTAIFSVVDSVLLRPLPYPDPAALVTAGEVQAGGRGAGGFSAGTLLDWRAQNQVFQSLAGWTRRGFNLSDARNLPERVEGLQVSWDFFKTLGILPALGRGFTSTDDRPGAPKVAILSHSLWQRRFGADPRVVGRPVIVDGAPCTLIGVMPAGFRFFHGPEMWVPLALDATTANRAVYYISGVARLKPGVSAAQARAQTDAIVKNAQRKDWSARVQPLADAFVVQKERDRLLVLLGAVGFVLLIACVNVANLLLARAGTRHRELAVRAALGAGRRRLIAQLLSESVLLALAGGLAGLLVAHWAVRLLPALVSPALLEGRAEIGLDWRVLAFTFALSVVCGLAFGILPAWRASGLRLQEALREGGRGASGTRGSLRSVLVAAEVALSLVLLASAGLMIRSLTAMQDVDLGFRRERLLTTRLAMAPPRFPSPGMVRGFYDQVLARVAALPGVRTASISMGQAPWDASEAAAIQLPGHPSPPPGQIRGAAIERVSPDYFRTMGIPLRSGRVFSSRDDAQAPPVAVVNQNFVTRYLAQSQPLGQRVALKQEMEIVGVVADVKFGGPEADSVPFLYLPVAQQPRAGGALALHTSVEPASLLAAVRAAVADADRETPVTGARTIEQIAAGSMLQPRTQTALMGVFAALALVLSALGVYGVMSYTVARSTHDMGIRMALGATARDLLGLVLRKGLLLTAAGLAAGLAGAFALTRFLTKLLFQVKPADPATFAAASVLLALVALAAAFVPARRAARVDPVVTLREE